MKKLKELFAKIKGIIGTELFIIELLFILGVFIILITNFIINKIFGLYFLGITLISLSIFLFKTRKEVNK